MIAHFRGFDSPESARQLAGVELTVASTSLPGLDQGDYYWHQLEGLAVINLDGLRFGVVRQLLETGANDVLVVRPDATSIDERERLIPYVTGSVIRQVDLDAGTVTVDWQADYLA